MYEKVVKPFGRTNFKFLDEGTSSQSTIPKQFTPLRFETCMFALDVT